MSHETRKTGGPFAAQIEFHEMKMWDTSVCLVSSSFFT